MPRIQWNHVTIQMPWLAQGRWGRSRFLQDGGRMCVDSLQEDWRCWKRWKQLGWSAVWLVKNGEWWQGLVSSECSSIQICKDFRRPDLIKHDLASTASAFKQMASYIQLLFVSCSAIWKRFGCHLLPTWLASWYLSIGTVGDVESQFSEPAVCSSCQSRGPSSGAGTYLGQQWLKMIGDGWSMVR